LPHSTDESPITNNAGASGDEEGERRGKVSQGSETEEGDNWV